MKVTRGDEATRDAQRAAGRRSFDLLLERLRSRDDGAGRARRSPARETGPGEAEGGGSPGVRSHVECGAPPALLLVAEERVKWGSRGGSPALPELREAARAIPPAIWSGRLADCAAVELTFGKELAVELRQVAGGIDLAIRASPALVRAAQSDVPALIRTLRAHGVTVVSARVRGAAPAAPRRDADVDARPPLR